MDIIYYSEGLSWYPSLVPLKMQFKALIYAKLLFSEGKNVSWG